MRRNLFRFLFSGLREHRSQHTLSRNVEGLGDVETAAAKIDSLVFGNLLLAMKEESEI